MKPLSEIYKERGLQGTLLRLPEPLQRYSVDIEQAKVYDNLKQRWLKGWINEFGYTVYHITENGTNKTVRVQRLIGHAICGRILSTHECISHDDEGFGVGNVNNNYKNLSLCTHTENMEMPNHRCRSRGNQHSKAIVVCKKSTMYPIGMSYSIKQLCKQFKLNPSNIRECLKGNRTQAYGFSFYYKDDFLKNSKHKDLLDYYSL